MAKLKFRGSKDGGFVLPPEGTFDLQAIEIKDDSTDKDGNQQVVVRWEIAAGPEEGKKFRIYYTMNEERSWVFRRTLDACGVDYLIADEDGDDVEFEVDPDDLLHCYMRARIEHFHANSGKTYVNLKDEQPSKLSQTPSSDGDEGDEESGSASDSEASDSEVLDNPPRRRRRRA